MKTPCPWLPLIYAIYTVSLTGCATHSERRDLISNPFPSFDHSSQGSVAGETLTIAPSEKARFEKLLETEESQTVDSSYKNHPPTLSDREISSAQKKISFEEETRRREIEQGLYLKPSSEKITDTKSTSYLARVDHIKSLYHLARYEAALLEVDELLIEYPQDSKTNEMRGTLLDRLGRRELALKAWNQALRLEPQNDALKRFISRKEIISTVPPITASPKSPTENFKNEQLNP